MPVYVKPDLPGTSIKITGESLQSVPPSLADTLAIPFQHDSGPIGSDAVAAGGGVRYLDEFADFDRIYGSSDTAGRRAVLQAFQGIGSGRGGAGRVVAYRMANATGLLAASKVLQNTTPAAAITLTAKYKGVGGNLISVAVIQDPRIPANNILRILYNGAEVERYSHLKTDITALAAAITNKPSSYVIPSAVLTGTALTVVGPTVLTGGNDGGTLTSVEWLAALDSFEYERFSILAPYLLTDSTIRAAIVAWVQAQEAASRPIMLVVGGDNSDTLSLATARSLAINDPHVVNLGVGIYHDDLLNRDLNTAELAPRIAGVIAARGLRSALTFADLIGLHFVSGALATTDLKAAKDGGVTAIHRAESPESDLHIVWGVTTFTTTTDAARPYPYFSEPRLVRLNDIFIRGMREWANQNIVGDLPVNNDTRDAVRTEGRTRIDAMLRDGLLEPGDTSRSIPAPFITTPISDDPNLKDAVLFEFGWQVAYTANFVLGNGRVR
jgi:hypothetical protein